MLALLFALGSAGGREADMPRFPLPDEIQGREIGEAEALAALQQQILDAVAGVYGAGLVFPRSSGAAGEGLRQLPAGGDLESVVEVTADGLIVSHDASRP